MDEKNKGRKKTEKLIEYLSYLEQQEFNKEEIGLIYLNLLIHTNKKKLLSHSAPSASSKYLRDAKRQFVEEMREKFMQLTNNMSEDKKRIYLAMESNSRLLTEKSEIIFGLESIAANSWQPSIEGTLLTKLKENNVSAYDIGCALMDGAREYANASKKQEKYFLEYQKISKHLNLVEVDN